MYAVYFAFHGSVEGIPLQLHDTHSYWHWVLLENSHSYSNVSIHVPLKGHGTGYQHWGGSTNRRRNTEHPCVCVCHQLGGIRFIRPSHESRHRCSDLRSRPRSMGLQPNSNRKLIAMASTLVAMAQVSTGSLGVAAQAGPTCRRIWRPHPRRKEQRWVAADVSCFELGCASCGICDQKRSKSVRTTEVICHVTHKVVMG